MNGGDSLHCAFSLMVVCVENKWFFWEGRFRVTALKYIAFFWGNANSR